MTVDGIPNVRVCTTPLRQGAVVKPQNVVGSLQRDLMAVTDKLGGPFTPPGFYYKTFIRPAEAVAAVREGAPQRGRAREARQARRARRSGSTSSTATSTRS